MLQTPARIRLAPPRLKQLLLVLAVSGCAVTSDQPLSQLVDSDPPPGYLLGVWDYVEVAGLNAGGSNGGVQFQLNGDGSLKITVADETGTFERSASLATVGNVNILSIAPNPGEETWGFAALSFEQATQKLTVTFLGHAEVVRDIGLGVVAGEVYNFDGRALGHLKASPDELGAYFAAHGDAFSDRVAVLKKRP